MSETRAIADRIADLPTPAEHALMVGHEGPLDAFRTAQDGGRAHHAWLLAGPRGIGKATAAYRMAADVLSGGTAEPDGAVVRQITGGGHPGLLTLSRPWDEKAKRFRTQLPVDEVRRTRAFFGHTAGGGEQRVCIVDAADDMNPSSANALLKILEEPPAQATFLVVAHSPGRLLPTIRSRCRTLAFKPLKDGEVADVVSRLSPDTSRDDLQQAVRVAAGAPRTAFTVLQGNVLAQFARFERIAARPDAPAWADVHALAEAATARGGDFETFLDLVFGWIGARARAEVGQGGSPGSLVRWARLWDDARETRERAATFNLDRKQVVLDLFALLFAGEGRSTPAR